MDEEQIKNGINEITSASPAATKEAAAEPIEAPAYATLRVGTSDQIQEAPAQQYATTPEQGIEFTKDTDEVIRAGTAIPGFGYDTRFKTSEDLGDPLYFEPNFQPVVPYPVGNFEADTVNKNKLAWNIAMTNYAAWDKDYIGYYRLPDPGSQSWWDFLIGGTMTNLESLPSTIAKGVTNTATSVGKATVVGAAINNSIWQGVMDKIMRESPDSDAGSLFNAIAKNYENSGTTTVVDELNNLQDIVADAVSPLEQHAFETWDADVADNSFKANSARGVSSGLVSFALAIATKNPEVAFTLLNFANVSDMRHRALDFGVSPGWAEAYSIGGGVVNSLLDMLQFEALVNSASLVKQGTLEYLTNLSAKGLWNGIKKHAPREAAVALGEAATEMLQTGIEEAYNSEFRKDPTDALAIAALSAFVLKAITLPVSVRHANQDEMAKVAEAAGVKGLLDQIRASGYIIADDMIAKGAIKADQRDAFVHSLISEAPDVMIRTLREGAKGELDKIPPEARKQMLSVLNDIKKNFVGEVFSPKTFAKLDSEVDTSLAGIRNGISDAEVEMIKGLVRGAYVNAAIANRNNPDYEGFQVPTFVIARNRKGRSYYDSKTNEIGIHESRSNTEYTNNSPQYAGRLQDSFVPSSRQSDKIASLIHEMSHWMDHVVGEKGFGDFLEHYYNSIATAFGNNTARRLYNEREGKGKERPSEYFAQTMGRMGKRSAEAFGLGKSQANKFLSYANIAMNQLANLEGRNGEKLSQSIADFQTALQQVTKANMDKLSDLIEVYGKDNIKQALANFDKDSEGYGDFAEYLANKDMLQELFDVMDSFSDAAGIDKINELFDGDQKAMDNFVTLGDKMFREGYDKAVDEVRQRRAEAKKTAPKPVEAKTDLDLVRTAIGIVDTTTDSSQVHEDGVYYETGYASMRGPLEGDTLDADTHYAEGEALGRLGNGMAHGYGNYILFDLGDNKEKYYDRFMRDATEQRQLEFQGVGENGLLRGEYMYPRLSDTIMSYINMNSSEDPNTITKSEYSKGIDTAIKNITDEINATKDAIDAGEQILQKTFGVTALSGHDFYVLQGMSLREFKMLDDKGLAQFNKDFASEVKTPEDFEDMKKFLWQYSREKISLSNLSSILNSVKEHKAAFDFDYKDKPGDFVVGKMNVNAPELHSFSIPDSEFLLNEEKALEDQSEYVREALRRMAEENPRISLFGGKYDLSEIQALISDPNSPYWSDYIEDDDLANLDGETFRRALQDYFWHDEEGQKERVKFFENKVTDKRELDGAIKTDAYRTVSLLLNKYGIRGIEYEGHSDGHGAVVFNGNIQHKERLYEQGGIQYETQDWAKAAMAKDSVKQSFEAGKQEKKQIAADTKIDGRDLTKDIDIANQGLMQRLKDPMNKLVKWASSSPWGWGLDRILVTLIGRGAAEKLDVQGKYAAKQNIRSRYWDEFMARLKPLFGDPKTNTEFMYKYKTMVNNLGFVRMTGLEMTDPVNPAITFTRDITGWEAMYVYLMKEQGFGDRVQRSTTTKIDDIIATLSDDEKAFALHMSDQLMSMYEKTFGKSKYAHYFPILDAEHELFDELSIDSLMSRQDTDDAIAITDAGRIFSQYISRWASHESNYFQTMKRVRDIFRYTGVDKNEMGPMYTFDLEQDEARKRASAQVAASVRQTIGDDGYRNLMNLVESELQDGQEQMFDASRNKTLTQMGSNIIKSILSNKMVSFPKNIANMFMFWGGAKDQGRYWNSFAEGIGNYRDTFKYMMEHSPEIKQRWGAAGGINEYLDQRTLGGSTAPVMKGISKVFAKMDWTGDKTQTMAKFSAVMEMLGDAGLKVFMQSGDMIANVYGGYGLVKDYMAQGMSEADAFRKLDRYIIEHQSSSNLTMKPLVQKLQNKSLLGQVFAFTSEGVAKWASILGTFDEVKMGTATKSEAMANVVSIAISMALYSLIAAGAWDLLDDDEKVQEETMKALGDTLIDQVFGGLVAGNAFITPVVSYLVGDSRVSGMSVPIYNFALDGIAALKKGDYDRVLTKAMSALGVPVGADNAWTTLLGMSMANDPNPDVRYAARLMLAGYTPSRSAKRAGIKKETLEKNSEE